MVMHITSHYSSLLLALNDHLLKKRSFFCKYCSTRLVTKLGYLLVLMVYMICFDFLKAEIKLKGKELKFVI